MQPFQGRRVCANDGDLSLRTVSRRRSRARQRSGLYQDAGWCVSIGGMSRGRGDHNVRKVVSGVFRQGRSRSVPTIMKYPQQSRSAEKSATERRRLTKALRKLVEVGVAYTARGYCDGQRLASPGRWPVQSWRCPTSETWLAAVNSFQSFSAVLRNCLRISPREESRLARLVRVKSGS